MTVAASYDPLYPLKGAVYVTPDILELVEIDIYQFLLCHDGKTAVFRHLQSRMMRVLKVDRLIYMALFGIIAILTALEIGVRTANWLRRRREASRQNEATAPPAGAGPGNGQHQHQQQQQPTGLGAPGSSPEATAGGTNNPRQESSTSSSGTHQS